MSERATFSSRWALLVCGMLVPLGCSAPSQTQPLEVGDSNTNWLSCDDAHRCGDELVCLCGLCTLPCTQDWECAAVRGVCAPQENVETCGATPVGGVCLPSGPEPSVLDAGSQPETPPRWRASASSFSSVEDGTADLLFNPPEQAIDRQEQTRWSSGKPQSGNEWFQVDFGESRTVSKVTLDLGLGSAVESMNDWPRGYSVTLSDRNEDFDAAPVAQGTGSSPITVIDLVPRTGRYLLIRQTAVSDAWWSIHEIEVE